MPHGSGLPLMKARACGSCQIHRVSADGGVGQVAEQQRVVAGSAARPGHAGVELEELGVAEEVDRVVRHRRVATRAVRRGDQLGDEPGVQPHRGHRAAVGVVDLEGHDQAGDADRAVDDAGRRRRVGGRAGRSPDRGRSCPTPRPHAGLRLADRGVVEVTACLARQGAGRAPARREQTAGHRAALDAQATTRSASRRRRPAGTTGARRSGAPRPRARPSGPRCRPVAWRP